jgi:hypothetical protein
MINSLTGIALSHCGHSATHKLLSEIVDATIPRCKKQLAGQGRTWEDR